MATESKKPKKLKEKKPNEKKIVFEDVMDPDYREYHVSRAWGGFAPDGSFQITLADEYQKPFTEVKGDENDVRMIRKHKVRIIMSPPTLKSISEWLNKWAQQIQVGQKPPIEKSSESDMKTMYR